MSGIAGIVRFDGGKPAPGALESITAALVHRGPDGIEHWHGEGAALGYCRLATTPEALGERQPLANEDASLVLVMDGRVDNREDLVRALTARGAVLRDASDAELVLRAYESWGEDCVDRIVAEAAFVVWHARERRIFAARDVAGARHFYFHAGAGWFAFASEIRGLLALGIPQRLNESRFLDNLVVEFDREDLVGTCYAGIERLPHGYVLAAGAGGVAMRRYWHPEHLEETPYRSYGDCVEAYRETLRSAVVARMRHVGTMGAALSGGLDSSSIVGLVRAFRGNGAQPLATFTLAHADRETCPEWRAVRSLCAEGGIDPVVIGPEAEADARPQMLRSMREMDEPFSFNNGYTDQLVCAAAKERGCRVLLDGMAGDLLFYWFDDSLPRGLRDLRELAGLVAAVRRHELPGISRMLAMRLVAAAFPEAVKRAYRRARGPYLPADARLLHRRLALELERRWRQQQPRIRDGRVAQARLFTSGLLAAPHEGYGQVAFAHGIEPRSPFSDRRVIELAIRLPRSAKVCNGWYKRLARDAMAGVLPDEVRWRRDLTMHPGAQFRQRFALGLARHEPGVWNPQLIGDRMSRWVDRPRFEAAWSDFERNADPLVAWPLLTLAAYTQWLEARPGVEREMEA